MDKELEQINYNIRGIVIAMGVVIAMFFWICYGLGRPL